jgi:hypothetical protein
MEFTLDQKAELIQTCSNPQPHCQFQAPAGKPAFSSTNYAQLVILDLVLKGPAECESGRTMHSGKETFNGLLLSESALAKDWNTPEEDAAWESL